MRGNNGPSEERHRYDLMYQRHNNQEEELAKPYGHLELKTTKATQSLTIDKPLGYGKNIDLYDSENCPKGIAVEAEDELDEDDKGPNIVKIEVVKP